MRSKARSAMMLAVILILTASSLGMQSTQDVSVVEQVITELFERFNLPVVSQEEYAQRYQESSSRLKMSGTWEAAAVVDSSGPGGQKTTVDGKPIEGASGLYFREAAKHYGPSGIQDLPLHQLCSSKITVGISNVAGEEYDALLQMELDDIPPEKRQFMQRVEYKGAMITAISLPRLTEEGQLMGHSQTAIWQYGKWYLVIKLFTDNGGFMSPNGSEVYEKCPFDTYELPALQSMYETLHDLSLQYGLAGTAPAAVGPKYSASCDISWSENAPMIFNVHVRDQEGNGLYGRPDDYLVVKIYWDVRRVPTNAVDGLLAVRPARPKDRVAFADAQGFQTQSTNPIMIEVLTDENGLARIFVRTDFWQYIPPISRTAPIAWDLEITRKYSALNAEGEAVIAEERLGTCRLSVDSIAYVWGVKGYVRSDNQQLESSRYLTKGDLLSGGDILTAMMDTGGSQSYAMFTYIDGTKFGMRGSCPQDGSASCDSLRISEMSWGYIFWTTFGVMAGEAKEEVAEFLIKTISPRISAPTSLVFIMQDVYSIGSYAFSQEWSDTCARLGSTPEQQAAVLNDFYQESNVDTRHRLRCTGMSVRSLVNIKIQNGQLDIQTFEGDPVITEDSGEVELTAGRQFTAQYDGTQAQISSFDADPETLDWDPAFFATEESISEYPEDLPDVPSSWSSDTTVPQISFLWTGFPAILCLGFSFVVLVVGFFSGNKKIRNTGGVLSILAICIGVFAFGLYLTQFFATPAQTPPTTGPVESEPQIASLPPEIASPQLPAAITDKPQTMEPTALPVESPFPQEISPQPSIYNFAACLQPCAPDLSNKQTTFAGGTQRIYIRFNYSWIPPGSEYARVWKNQGDEWVRYQCQWDGPENGVFETSLREPGGLRSGEWTLEIYVDGQQIFETSVTVDGNWDFWEPARTIDRCQ